MNEQRVLEIVKRYLENNRPVGAMIEVIEIKDTGNVSRYCSCKVVAV